MSENCLLKVTYWWGIYYRQYQLIKRIKNSKELYQFYFMGELIIGKESIYEAM